MRWSVKLIGGYYHGDSWITEPGVSYLFGVIIRDARTVEKAQDAILDAYELAKTSWA